MKPFLPFLLIGVCCQICADEIDDELEKLNSNWESLYSEVVRVEPKEKRRKEFEKMREYASAWNPFSFLYRVYGSDELQEDATEEIMVDSVYSPFLAEREHYERTIIHTEGDDERAVELMGRRAETISRLYPVGAPPTLKEELYFAQFMCRVYLWSPDRVCEALDEGLERWNGGERLVPLLILAHDGSEDAKGESKQFDSKKVRRLSIAIDSLLSGVDNENTRNQ